VAEILDVIENSY